MKLLASQFYGHYLDFLSVECEINDKPQHTAFVIANIIHCWNCIVSKNMDKIEQQPTKKYFIWI